MFFFSNILLKIDNICLNYYNKLDKVILLILEL